MIALVLIIIIKFTIYFVDNPNYMNCYSFPANSNERFECIQEFRKLPQCDYRRFDKFYRIKKDTLNLTKFQWYKLRDSVNYHFAFIDSCNKYPNANDPTVIRLNFVVNAIRDTFKSNSDSTIIWWYTAKYNLLTNADCKKN